MSTFNRKRATRLCLISAAAAAAITAGAVAPSVANLTATSGSATTSLALDPNNAVVLYQGVVYRAFIDGSPDLTSRVVGP